MRKKWVARQLLFFLVLGVGLCPAFAGDSLYGRITEVKSADVVTLDYGGGQYDLKLVGIDVPEALMGDQARQFVADMVLGKNARMRFDHRTKEGVMLARLFTDDPDPAIGIKDVAMEMVRAGMARRQKNFDFKYGELAAAEREAQSARRGMWATTDPQ